MKTILILGIIIECGILALLTILKKWTRRSFLAVTIITAVCCGIVWLMGKTVGNPDGKDMKRSGLYMAARLIQEEFYEESLEVLSGISDQEGDDLRARTIRALAYNLNQAYETGEIYLDYCDNEDEQLIAEACAGKKAVSEEDQRRITDSELELIGASEQEARQWEAEMKVRFMDFDLKPEEKTLVTENLALAKTAIAEKRYEDAYNSLAKESSGGDVKNGVLVSGMYVKNYNLRVMTDGDEEYARIWNQASSVQAELNVAALDVEPGETTGEAYTKYRKISAEYALAMEELNQEAAKRAINYLKSFEDVKTETNIGYQLQMAQLYFISRQMDEAKECLEQIFTTEQIDEEQWLGREAEALRQAYILSLSNPVSDESNILFDRLMNSLYQSMFDDVDYSAFKEFVFAYLRELYSGIVIRKIDITQFPQITAGVSVTKEGIRIDEENVLMTDTGEEIHDFQVETIQVSDLSLCFVLDRSGSMQGNAMSQSKNAIRSCIGDLSEEAFISLVTFANDASLECGLSQSKYMVMNLVEGVSADGGTNMASGLETALDSLTAMQGTKVIILLSDGYDQDTSKESMDSILAEAAAANVVIYAVGLEGCDEAYLKKIADRTGGQFIMVTNIAQLTKVYQEIQTSLMQSYLITYHVSDDAEIRYLEIRDKNSLAQAKKRYSPAESEESSPIYIGGQQEAGYYKQTGGTDNGR